MVGFTMIDLVVLVVYLLAVLFAGLFFSKKEMKGKEFFKGDGTIPWWVTSVSIFATLLSPISFLSLAGNSYAGSWILWFAQLGMFIAIPLTIRYFLPLYSRLEIDTAYQYLEMRYESKGLRILGALMFIIYQIGRMSIIMYLPSVVLSTINRYKCKCSYSSNGYNSNNILLHWWFKSRFMDRFHTGNGSYNRCKWCVNIHDKPDKRWIWRSNEYSYNRK